MAYIESAQNFTIDREHLINESPCLKSDCFEDIKAFSEKESQAFHYKETVQIFYHKPIKVKHDGSC